MIKRAKWFEDTVAKHLMESSLKSGRNNGIIRASSVGSKCLRKLGYMVLGYEEQPHGAHSAYVLNFGNAFHDMVQGWMADMGLVKATPHLDENYNMQWSGDAEGTIVDADLGITGHYDGLTQNIGLKNGLCALDPNGKRYVLEFKTMSNKSRVQAIFLEDFGSVDNPDLCTVKYVVKPGQTLFSSLDPLPGSPPKPLNSKGNEIFLKMVEREGLQSGDLLNCAHKGGQWSELTKPKDEHIQQATFYASRLKANAILIVYLAKDLSEDSYEEESLWNVPIKAFELNVEDKNIGVLKNKAGELWHYLETGQKTRPNDPESWLPPREWDDPLQPFADCKFCPYLYVCHKDNEFIQDKLIKKFEEQSLANLPVASGKPFVKHDKNNWGRIAAKEGLIKDDHGQDAIIISTQVNEFEPVNVSYKNVPDLDFG